MLVRGFKSWSEEVSQQLRDELGVAKFGPLDPDKLAGALGIELWTPTDVPGLSSEVSRRLTGVHAECWSAVTITNSERSIIIFNPAHTGGRRTSDITHELAHVLLGHEPGLVFMAPRSGVVLRTHDKDQEAEASWLAGALLLPRDALLHIIKRKFPDSEACKMYGVSGQLLQYRLNVTGVRIQFARARSWTNKV